MSNADAESEAAMRRFPAEALHAQVVAVLTAWGFAPEHAQASAHVMVEADLNGIDSHGLAMLLYYEGLVQARALNPAPEIKALRESPATALLDGDGGLGHGVSVQAIELACDKAQAVGVGAVAVRKSDHFGAAGVYAARAAARGMVSLITSNGFTRCVVPAGGARPMFSTNPIAFGAPRRTEPPMMFDIATSTASIGKVNLAWLAGKEIPPGWVVDGAGRPVTDPAQARVIIYETGEGGLTPLGGTPEMSAHKGYGICTMIEVLSALLSGATAAPLQTGREPGLGGTDTGHFFLALNPDAFRPLSEFHAEMDRLIDTLRATPPADPGQPVMAPGDIEWRTRAARQGAGVPVPVKLLEELSTLCIRAGAPLLLT
jgi:LDH2 family malate/lactate/ureidoglycolate dehydrogenase